MTAEPMVIERPRQATFTATSDAAAVAHFRKAVDPGHGWTVEKVRVVRRLGNQRTVAGVLRLVK